MKKYEIIQNELKAQMSSGSLKPGDKLPSESELCRAYAVSRNVVRQALRNLEAEGLTETLKGIGSFAPYSADTTGQDENDRVHLLLHP